jgi:hypothetical protein
MQEVNQSNPFKENSRMLRKSLFSVLILLANILIGIQNLWALTANVTDLSFDNQEIGTISDPQTVSLTNDSGADGSIGVITLGGKDPQQFLISQDNCSLTVLANGASCTLQVDYRPSLQFPDGIGSAQAILLVAFDNSPALSMIVNGTSIAPEIDSNFSELDFGTGTIGQLSKPITVTLTNTGQANLTLDDTSIIGQNSADFGVAMDLCSFQSLPPGQSCQIQITMRPTDVGVRQAELVIPNNDPDESIFLIQLNGGGKGSGGCSLNPGDAQSSEMNVWGLLLAFALLVRFRKGKQILSRPVPPSL